MRRYWVGCVALVTWSLSARADVPPVPPEPPPPLVAPPEPPPLVVSPEPPPPPPPPPLVVTPERAAAEAACIGHDPTCNWVQTYGALEKQSLKRALIARGLAPDPEPWGKKIDRIEVYNEKVFAEGCDGVWWTFGCDVLKWTVNHIHYTTREFAIRDELTLDVGEVWDQARVEESGRRLRDPLYSSVIALIPVKSTTPGNVTLLVVTRDVFSLRLNTQYTAQQVLGRTRLTNLSISLSENNFLGQRNLVAATMTMDEGAIAVGPQFIDKNVFGSHLTLSASVADILTRHAVAPLDPVGLEDAHKFHSEGSSSAVALALPLWSLASEWGAGASFSHNFGVARSFGGMAPLAPAGLRSYDDPNTPGLDMLPYEYRLKVWSANVNVVHQWGTKIKSQLAIGQTVTSQRPSALPDFPGTPEQLADFERDVFPRSEVTSAPYIEYTLFMPRYRMLHDVSTYDLVEDIKDGPDLDVVLAKGLQWLGSTDNYVKPSASAGWTFPWCRDGFIRPSAGVSMRFQDGTTIDNTADVALRVGTPIYRYFRIVAQGEVDTRWHDTQNAFYAIGSDSGLRGYPIGEFIGQRRATGMLELRSMPIAFWVLRFGAVAFYEAGGAANSFGDMQLHQDAGFGLRFLLPQTSRDIWRFDLAFPFDAVPGSPAGVPHFIAGFGSYF